LPLVHEVVVTPVATALYPLDEDVCDCNTV
jgi:hypothetical protein